MKKAFLLIIILFAAISLSAQTQQSQKGIVKTKGRMVNGQHVKGHGLNGVTISLMGRNDVIVRNDDGSFSFPVLGKNYTVTKVAKSGYQLVDADAAPKAYAYSTNTHTLVMETPEQQLQDKLDTERKIRRTLQKQLQQRESEIDAMQVSMAEKQKLLQKLYADQENNERLISDMAKRYSELDYDQLDDFYRQVNYCIENGDLTKADSLLRTRGDVRAQVSEQLQKGQVISMKEEELAKAKAVHAADNEELAKRCYSFYEEFLAQHQNDSAAYYLELRAKLDTTNIEWQNEAGRFIDDYLADYSKALNYYQLVLRQSLAQEGEESKWVATAYNNIGYVYHNQGDYPKALEYLSKALAILEKVLGTEHPDVATSYNNIGGVYDSQGDYPKALECYSKALAIREKVLGPNHPNTINIKQSILNTKYQMAIANKNARAFCEEHCFTATIVEGNTPAKQQGMSGEYVLLEFADWNQDSDTSLFDKSEELKGKPKNILVMKDGIISQHHFENVIGAQSGLKYVGREEKQRINKAYEEWKKKRKMNSQ